MAAGAEAAGSLMQCGCLLLLLRLEQDVRGCFSCAGLHCVLHSGVYCRIVARVSLFEQAFGKAARCC